MLKLVNNNQVGHRILAPSINQLSFARKVVASNDGSVVFTSAVVEINNEEVHVVIQYIKDKAGRYIMRDTILPVVTQGRYSYFGWDMALSTDKSTLIISSPCIGLYLEDNQDPGYIYVYKLSDSGNYVLTDTILSEDKDEFNKSYFGSTIAINYDGSIIASKDTLKVPNQLSVTESGFHYISVVSVFIRLKRKYVKKWTLRDDHEVIESFGNHIAMSAFGVKIVVTGSSDVVYQEVYVFEYDTPSRDYRLQSRLSKFHSKNIYHDPTIDINREGNTIVVGSKNTVFVYEEKDKEWSYTNEVKHHISDKNNAKSRLTRYNVKLSPKETSIVLSHVGLHDTDKECTMLQVFNRVDKSSTTWTNSSNVKYVSEEVILLSEPSISSDDREVLLGVQVLTDTDSSTRGYISSTTGYIQSIIVK